jgi:hypothetical protein
LRLGLGGVVWRLKVILMAFLAFSQKRHNRARFSIEPIKQLIVLTPIGSWEVYKEP